MIVVEKCILSSRNNDAIVIIIVRNDGKYAFMIKNAGFLFKVNSKTADDPFMDFLKLKFVIVN